MKLGALFLFFFVAFGISSAMAVGCAGSTACYWVGGTGNWSDTTHWATTSGGAITGSVPTSTDDAIFDANSNNPAYTVTVDATANCKNLNFSHAPFASGTIIWAGSAALNVYGNSTFLSGMTANYTGNLTYLATSGTKTITSNSVTLKSGTIAFSGVGGTWQLQDNFTHNDASLSTLSLTNGTLDLNGKTMTVLRFTSTGAATRVLTFGAGTLASIFYGDNYSYPFVFSGSGLTINGTATGTMTMINTGSYPSYGNRFYGGGFSFPTLNISGGVGVARILDTNTFANLSYTQGASYVDGYFTFFNNQTVTGTFTVTGPSVIDRILVNSDTWGTPRTITAATVSVANTDFEDITGVGAGNWDLHAETGGSGDAGGNSGITFTTPVTRYWVGNGGSWSSTSQWSALPGGASGVTAPLAQDTVIFDASSITSNAQGIGFDIPRLGKNIDMTNLAHSPSFSGSNAGYTYVYGSFTGPTGSTPTYNTSASSVFNFEPRSNSSYTNNNFSWGHGVAFEPVNCTMTLGGNATFETSLSIAPTTGTFDANNYNLTATNFSLVNSSTTLMKMGSGTWTATGTGAVWDNSTSTATGIIAGTSTLKLTDTSSTGKQFYGGGTTYNNFWYAPGAGTGILSVDGNNRFNDFKDDGSAAHTISFTAASTQTMVYWHVSGTSGNLITINSSSTGVHSLKSLGGPVTADYLNIQHSVATPASSWFAGAHSTNNQGVATAGSGWAFLAAPLGTKYFGGTKTVLNNMVFN